MRLYLSTCFFSLVFLVKAQQNLFPKETQIQQSAAATIKLDGYPDFLAADEDGVWVTNDGRVEKLIFGKSSPIKTIKIPTPCGAMAVGYGSLWVASCREKSVYRVNINSGEITEVIATGLADTDGELSIAIGAGSVWLLTNKSGELSRIDPKTNKVVKRISVLPNSFAAVFGFNSVWITNTEAGSVQRIDPIKEKVITTISVGPTPRFLAVGSGAVWTLNQGDGTVTRIDPVTNKLITTIAAEVAGSGGDIAAGVNKIYVRAKGTLLSVIDPITNRVERRYGPPAGSGAVRVENGRVWVSAHDINTIWVLKE